MTPFFSFFFFRGQYFHFVIFPQYGKSRKKPVLFLPHPKMQRQNEKVNFKLISLLYFQHVSSSSSSPVKTGESQHLLQKVRWSLTLNSCHCQLNFFRDETIFLHFCVGLKFGANTFCRVALNRMTLTRAMSQYFECCSSTDICKID